MRTLLICLVALVLTACSTTPVTRTESQPVTSAQVLSVELTRPSSERTLPVLLIRDKGFMGSIMEAIVAIDGVNAVLLKPGQRFNFYLAPGNHMFSVTPAKNPLGEATAETDVEIRPMGPNSFRLRLVSGDGPRIERSIQIQE